MTDPTVDMRMCKACDELLPAPTNGRWKTYCSIKCKRRDQRASSERTITCDTCDTPFTTRRPDGKYCSPACRNPGAKRCTEDGCERPAVAKGLCGTDWRRQYGKRAKAVVPCAACGTDVQKNADSNRRPVCSTMCRNFLRHGSWPISVVPIAHPVRGNLILGRHPVNVMLVPLDHPSRWPYLNATCPVYYGDCASCGRAFVDGAPIRRAYCNSRCSALTRQRAKGDGDHFTWAELMDLFVAFGRCCAYCGLSIRVPSPDHVTPLSRGGSNSIANILPVCRSCNSAKCDLTLREWAEHRLSRGLEPRATSWPPSDLRYAHLRLHEPARPRVTSIRGQLA